MSKNKDAKLLINGKKFDTNEDKWFNTCEEVTVNCRNIQATKIVQIGELVRTIFQCDGRMSYNTNYLRPLIEFQTDGTGIENPEPKIHAELVILGKKYETDKWVDTGEIVKVNMENVTKLQSKQIQVIISAMLQIDDFQKYERKVEPTERKDGETEVECAERCSGMAMHEIRYEADKAQLDREFKEFLVEQEKSYNELHEEFFYEELQEKLI